jgi:hypothetical protein
MTAILGIALGLGTRQGRGGLKKCPYARFFAFPALWRRLLAA